MKVEYGLDNLPICPDCNEQLDCEDSNGRDSETMGGYSVSYYVCTNCKEHYEMTHTGFDGNKLYPCSP